MTTPARDPVNGWIHLSGAVLAAIGLVVLAAAALERGSPRHAIAAGVFGVSAVLMFTASATYHLARRSPRSALYHRLDHAMIYVMIAGTYTPLCLIALYPSPLGTWLLVAVWTLALVGVLEKALWRRAPRGLSTALYVGLGWLGALAAPTLLRSGANRLFSWMLAGGIIYTLGAVVYWARWPRGRPGVFGFHELWHLCVLSAAASHYWAVLAYLVAPVT
jgi:hemolysin III